MADMKLHRAAAHALVAWYLMVPPAVAHMSPPVDLEAPLSEWWLFSSHETVTECEQELVTFYKIARTELVANPGDEDDRIQFHQLENSQCVASDDPRLTEK